MKLTIGKFTLDIKVKIKRVRYYRIYSDLIHEYVGMTCDPHFLKEEGHTLVPITRGEFLKRLSE
jgi:hypothetical protein